LEKQLTNHFYLLVISESPQRVPEKLIATNQTFVARIQTSHSAEEDSRVDEGVMKG